MPDQTRARLPRNRSMWQLCVSAAVPAVIVCASAAAASPNAVSHAYRLVRTIPLPGTAAQGWDSLACDPDSRRVYIAHGTEEDVIDTRTGQLAGAITGLAGCHGSAIDASDGYGFIASGGTNTVVAFNLGTLEIEKVIPIAGSPDSVAYQPDYHRVGVFSGGANIMTVIDAKTFKPVGIVHLPGRPGFAAAADNGFIYANIIDRSELVEIDPRAFTIGNTYPVAPGEQPTGLAIDDKKGRLFSACSNQTLIALNADNGVVLSSLPIGAGAGACAFDPGLARIYTSNGLSGTITIAGRLQATKDQYAVAATLPTLPGARTLTVDTKTHHLFVAAPSGGALVVLEYAPTGK